MPKSAPSPLKKRLQQPPTAAAPQAPVASVADNGKFTPRRSTQVRRSGVHGKGVYALRDFEPGEFIIEYKGERISWPEAERRHEAKEGDPFHTFFFQTEQGDVIDGGVRGNSARWINHSCEPNCETQEDDDGRVFVTAIVPIAAGQELFYDYALEIDARLTKALKKDYACYCGSALCRGTMLKTRRKKSSGEAVGNRDGKHKGKSKRKQP